jgi:hypothetical protein
MKMLTKGTSIESTGSPTKRPDLPRGLPLALRATMTNVSVRCGSLQARLMVQLTSTFVRKSELSRRTIAEVSSFVVEVKASEIVPAGMFPLPIHINSSAGTFGINYTMRFPRCKYIFWDKSSRDHPTGDDSQDRDMWNSVGDICTSFLTSLNLRGSSVWMNS